MITTRHARQNELAYLDKVQAYWMHGQAKGEPTNKGHRMTTATQITKPEMTDMVKRYIELREKFAATIDEMSGSRMLPFSSYLQPRYDRTTTDELDLATEWIAAKAELAAEATKLATQMEFMISIGCDVALNDYQTAMGDYAKAINDAAKAAN